MRNKIILILLLSLVYTPLANATILYNRIAALTPAGDIQGIIGDNVQILLDEGTWTLSSPLLLGYYDNLTIRGKGKGVTTIVYKPSSTPCSGVISNSFAIYISVGACRQMTTSETVGSTYVTIEDLTLDLNTNTNGIVVIGDNPASSPASTNTSTAANKLIDSGAGFVAAGVMINDTAVNITDGTQALVTAIDSAIQLSLNADIFTGTGKTYVIHRNIFADHITIKNVEVKNSAGGIVALFTQNSTFEHNTIGVGARTANTHAYGILIGENGYGDNPTYFGESKGNKIIYNTVTTAPNSTCDANCSGSGGSSGCCNHGIGLSGADNNIVSNNIVSGNSVGVSHGVRILYSNLINPSSNNTISTNIVYGMGGAGIYVGGKYNTVSSNKISNCPTGVAITDGGVGISVATNNIYNENTGVIGIDLKGITYSSVVGNLSFLGLTSYHVYFNPNLGNSDINIVGNSWHGGGSYGVFVPDTIYTQSRIDVKNNQGSAGLDPLLQADTASDTAAWYVHGNSYPGVLCTNITGECTATAPDNYDNVP